MIAAMLKSSDKPPLSNVPFLAVDGGKGQNQDLPDKKELRIMWMIMHGSRDWACTDDVADHTVIT